MNSALSYARQDLPTRERTMAITRIEQRTQTDCMVACLAMILDLSYDTVAEWFDSSRRSPNSLADAARPPSNAQSL